MNQVKIILEAEIGKRFKYDVKEHQKILETRSDKYRKNPIIPTPEGFHWISTSGGFFAYEKTLPGGKVMRLYGGEGNDRLRVYKNTHGDEFSNNAALIFKNQEDADEGNEPESVEHFVNAAGLDKILAKWSK